MVRKILAQMPNKTQVKQSNIRSAVWAETASIEMENLNHLTHPATHRDHIKWKIEAGVQAVGDED